MEVLTVHLPKLGVELLPLQFKQLKEKEEVIQMALKAHAEVSLAIVSILKYPAFAFRGSGETAVQRQKSGQRAAKQ
jgi:hypothetical protein